LKLVTGQMAVVTVTVIVELLKVRDRPRA